MFHRLQWGVYNIFIHFPTHLYHPTNILMLEFDWKWLVCPKLHIFWGKGSNSSKLQAHFPHDSFQGLLASHYHSFSIPLFLVVSIRGKTSISHRIHVCYIYGNIYHQYTPNVSIYIYTPAPWIRHGFLSPPGPLVRATSRAPPFRQKRWRTVWSCWTTGARSCDASPARSPTDACRGRRDDGDAGGSFQMLSHICSMVLEYESQHLPNINHPVM